MSTLPELNPTQATDQLHASGAALLQFAVVAPEILKTKYDMDGLLIGSGLQTEIAVAQQEGVNVSVYPNTDPSYKDPSKIRFVHDVLRSLQDGYNDFAANIDPAKNRKQKNVELDEYRRANMFDGEVNGDPIMGGPWLDQGGSARALLTIDIAHQLIAGHDTMAGSIGPEVLEQNIGGMSLTEALMTHQGMSALEAQTTLTQLEQFIAAPVTEAFQLIVENCPDSLGIRDRAEITLNTTIEHVLYLQEAGKLPPRPRLMSVGCGNGTTMLKAAQELRDTHGIHVQLEMFDQDPISLAFLKQTAENMGLTDAVNIHCLSIVKKTNRREIIDFSEHMGIQSDDEKPVVSENSGLIEYFKDDMNAKINQACMDALHPDAINISGNMLDKRPLKDYLRGMMGWPLRVIMRSIPQMVDIYEGMGIPREALDVRVTRDGVYAMYLTNMARLSAIKAEQEPVAHARTLRIVGLETTEVTA